MASNILTVAVGLFELSIQNRYSYEVTIDVIISAVAVCYGAIYVQKWWRIVGTKGIVPCSNAVPVFGSGILSLL